MSLELQLLNRNSELPEGEAVARQVTHAADRLKYRPLFIELGGGTRGVTRSKILPLKGLTERGCIRLRASHAKVMLDGQAIHRRDTRPGKKVDGEFDS